jgi:hypothetical protein
MKLTEKERIAAFEHAKGLVRQLVELTGGNVLLLWDVQDENLGFRMCKLAGGNPFACQRMAHIYVEMDDSETLALEIAKVLPMDDDG